MAGEREIRCVGPSYYLADRKTAVQRAVNLYMMQVEGLGEDSPLVLESTPGLLLVADLGAPIRGLHPAEGRFFIAAGSALQEMSTAEVMTNRGALIASTGYVSMTHGTRQLAIVDGTNLQVFNTDTNTMSTVTSAGWRGSKLAEFIDGYFVFVAPSTEQFYISRFTGGVDDATNLNAVDFSSADSQPDNIVAQIVRKRELYLFGTHSCEVWINSGALDFPFVRYQGTPIDVGLVGYRAVCRAADTLIWIGQTERGGPYVYRMQGFQPRRISDQAVEQQLSSVDYTQAVCWSYQEAGSEFVCINAPGMPTTWCWDAATEQWHERGELLAGAWTPSRIEYTAFFNGVHYASAGTKLYRMSRSYRDLAGDSLVRERTWPHLVAPSLEPRTYLGLELRCTTGDATAGSITLELSNDGGSVFGAPLRRSLGAVGARAQRVRWLALGTCPGGGSRVHRLRCSDAVPLTIQGAALS